MLDDGRDCDLRGLLNRISVGARSKRWERDALQRVSIREQKRIRISTAQQLRILCSTAIDRRNRMNHVARRQIARTRDHGLTRRAAANAATFLHDRRTTGAVNRAVDAASARERRIGCIHDRIRSNARDIALQ